MAVDFSFNALTDLELIKDYISQRSGNPKVAAKFIETLIAEVQLLDTFPQAGFPRDDLLINMRQLNIKGYIFLYEPTETGVVVKAVTRKGRDLPSMFKQ